MLIFDFKFALGVSNNMHLLLSLTKLPLREVGIVCCTCSCTCTGAGPWYEVQTIVPYRSRYR